MGVHCLHGGLGGGGCSVFAIFDHCIASNAVCGCFPLPLGRRGPVAHREPPGASTSASWRCEATARSNGEAGLAAAWHGRAMLKNYHDVLGLERGASAEDIKSAYLRLAMKYHPDRNKDKGAEERFKEVKEAYEVLSGQRKRPGYDALAAAFANLAQNQADIIMLLREIHQDLREMNRDLKSMNKDMAATTKRMREERIWRSRKCREETIRESSKFREETSQKISDFQRDTEQRFSKTQKEISDTKSSLIMWMAGLAIAAVVGVSVIWSRFL